MVAVGRGNHADVSNLDGRLPLSSLFKKSPQLVPEGTGKMAAEESRLGKTESVRYKEPYEKGLGKGGPGLEGVSWDMGGGVIIAAHRVFGGRLVTCQEWESLER